MPIYKEVNHNFFKTWSPEMAYVLGYIAADGAITIGQRGNYYLDLFSIDKELILLVKRRLNSKHKVTAQEPKKQTEHRRYRIQIGSKEIIRDLSKLGIAPKKTRRLIFPGIPPQHLHHFVRGYFDGDGHVTLCTYQRRNRPRPSTVLYSGFTSCSKRFLIKLKRLLKDSGDLRGGSFHISHGVYRISYAQNDSKKLFKFIYQGSRGLSLQRKYKSFILAMQKMKKHKWAGSSVG